MSVQQKKGIWLHDPGGIAPLRVSKSELAKKFVARSPSDEPPVVLTQWWSFCHRFIYLISATCCIRLFNREKNMNIFLNSQSDMVIFRILNFIRSIFAESILVNNFQGACKKACSSLVCLLVLVCQQYGLSGHFLIQVYSYDTCVYILCVADSGRMQLSTKIVTLSNEYGRIDKVDSKHWFLHRGHIGIVCGSTVW